MYSRKDQDHAASTSSDVRMFDNGRPPPPMYQRVPPPPAHMMTLDRRTGGRHLEHQLLPNGCDVTLNRRHFNNNTNQRMHQQRRRIADDLWLV